MHPQPRQRLPSHLATIAQWTRDADDALLCLRRDGTVWFYAAVCRRGVRLVNVRGDLAAVNAWAARKGFRRLVGLTLHGGYMDCPECVRPQECTEREEAPIPATEPDIDLDELFTDYGGEG